MYMYYTSLASHNPFANDKGLGTSYRAACTLWNADVVTNHMENELF